MSTLGISGGASNDAVAKFMMWAQHMAAKSSNHFSTVGVPYC